MSSTNLLCKDLITTINADLIVEFLVIRDDDFGNTIAYFKILNSNDLNPLLIIEDDTLKMPYWKSQATDKYILKIKSKHIKNIDNLTPGSVYTINVDFEYFIMKGLNINGYYVKLNSYNKNN
jgi:hypothetical protein